MRIRARANLGVFGQVLAGGLHFPGATDFALAPGGGVVILMPDKPYRFEVTLDFLIDFVSGSHETDTRFGGGVVFPIGHK
jgi:hypothetical protein